MEQQNTIDISSPAFAKRLANLLTDTRKRQGVSFRAMAKRDDRPFVVADLKRFEAGTMPLDHDVVERVTEIYEADLGQILPARLPVVVLAGVVSAGGVKAAFTPHDSTSLLEAYLKLVRQLRREHKSPMLELRRHDIDALATYLSEPGETIVERLAALMGAARPQRTAMAALFASGALVIGLVGAVAAAHGGAGDGSSAPSAGRITTAPAAAVVAAAASDGSTATAAPAGKAAPSDAASPAPNPAATGASFGVDAALVGIADQVAASSSKGGGVVVKPSAVGGSVQGSTGTHDIGTPAVPNGGTGDGAGLSDANGTVVDAPPIGVVSGAGEPAPSTTIAVGSVSEAGSPGQVIVPTTTAANGSGNTDISVAPTSTAGTSGSGDTGGAGGGGATDPGIAPTTTSPAGGSSGHHEQENDAKHKREAKRKADAKRKAEAKRKADAKRKAEAERKADATRQAEGSHHDHGPT